MFAFVAFFPGETAAAGDVTAPTIDSATYTDGTQSLAVTVTETNPNRLYWALVTNPSTPSAAQVVAGTGGGILEAGDVSYVGGTFSGTISVTNEAGDEIHLVATDVAGNQSTVSIVTGVVVDSTLPTADSAVTDVAGDTITITTSETVSGTPATGDFSFSGITAGTPTIDSVTVSGTSITIEISGNLVANGDTVTVSYTKGGNVIQDAYGNELATFASLAVTNNVSGGSYTQNFVDTNGTSDLSSATYGGNETAITYSAWVKFASVTGTEKILDVDGRSSFSKTNANLSVSLVDTGNNSAYSSATSSAAFSIGVLAHIYIAADFANDTLVIEVDGVAPTMNTNVSTFASVTGLVDMDRATTFVADGVQAIDAEFSDIAVFNTIVSNSLLYNGGTPPDPEAFATTPLVLLGGSMTADERLGNTAQGWNDGYNLGSGGALTVNAGNFTDV